VYKTVIFDLGKVIVPFDFQRGYEAMRLHCGLSPADIQSRIRETGLVGPFESGQVDASDFVEQLTRALGMNMPYDDFCQMWNVVFLPETLVKEEMVEGLKKRYRLVLLSNTNSIHFEMIRDRYPILRHFDEYVLSYRVGALKPSRRIYEAAVEKAQCEPHECFFTDDIPEYVEGARRAGIDAVQFQSAAQLEDEFRKRGIQWE
jgi:putative hydrolase of the HAD superfamily